MANIHIFLTEDSVDHKKDVAGFVLSRGQYHIKLYLMSYLRSVTTVSLSFHRDL